MHEENTLMSTIINWKQEKCFHRYFTSSSRTLTHELWVLVCCSTDRATGLLEFIREWIVVYMHKAAVIKMNWFDSSQLLQFQLNPSSGKLNVPGLGIDKYKHELRNSVAEVKFEPTASRFLILSFNKNLGNLNHIQFIESFTQFLNVLTSTGWVKKSIHV